jgi:hypothetical protein
MRRSLLATTAISALVLASPLALAQVPQGGAIQEQPRDQQHPPPKGAQPMTPAPSPTAPGKGAQMETPPAHQQPQTPQRLQGQAQPQTQAPTGQQQRLQGQAQIGPQHMPTGPRGQVQVTAQQRTQLHERLAHFRAERIEHAGFSVSVGVEIPRSVHIEALPLEIVEIVPEYEGFDYVVVGDEIVIIDPGTLQIVAVIPA